MITIEHLSGGRVEFGLGAGWHEPEFRAFHYDLLPGKQRLDRVEEAMVVMRSFLDKCGPTQHLLANLAIDVHGPRAASRCYVSDLHVGAGEKSHLIFSTLGEYGDDWRRVDGRRRTIHQ